MSFVNEILAAIERSGMSERAVSIRVFGHDSAIRDLKRTGNITAVRLERLCDELGLELYVGPPRAVISGFSDAPAPYVIDGDPEDGWLQTGAAAPREPFVIKTMIDVDHEIPAGSAMIVDPGAELCEGGRIFVEDCHKRIAIGRLGGRSPAGWIRLAKWSGEIVEELSPDFVTAMYPIIWSGPPSTLSGLFASGLGAPPIATAALLARVDEILSTAQSEVSTYLKQTLGDDDG